MKRILYIPFDHLHRNYGALKDANPKEDVIAFVESARMTTGRNWHKERLFFLISSARHFAASLEKEGFTVEAGVAGIPTAFTATFGSGTPVIGVLGEYDALPGFSQDAVPFKKELAGNTNGHACGHHLFGSASAAAAIAVKNCWYCRVGALSKVLFFWGFFVSPANMMAGV